MTVYWRHEPVERNAGERTLPEVDMAKVPVARTGILTDEHTEVSDDSPVLVEDVTNRVYRAPDLPPDTTVAVAELGVPPQPSVIATKRAGFHVVDAGVGTPL